MGYKFAVLGSGQPISKLQLAVFKYGNFWAMILWFYHYSMGGRVSLPAFQCNGIRIWNFECSSNIWLWLVRGSTSGRFSGRFFFIREIFWHSRGSKSCILFLIVERYCQVRGSISLSSESFGGGTFASGCAARADLLFSSPADYFPLAPPSSFFIPPQSPPSALDAGHLLWGSFFDGCLPWYLSLVDS